MATGTASAIVLMALGVASLVGLSSCGPASPSGYRIYVTNEQSGDLTVIDGVSSQVIATVPVGKRPRGVRVGAGARRLFIALSGSPVAPPGVDDSKLPPPDNEADGIGVFDTRSDRLERVLRGVANPEQLAVGKGDTLFVGSEPASAVVVLDPQPSTNIEVGQEPEGVALSPDGRFLYVTLEGDNQVAVIDAASRRLIRRFAVGSRPRGVAFTPDGTRAFVANELDSSVSLIDARLHQVVGTVRLTGRDCRPMGVAVSPDGKRVYVTTGRGGSLVALETTSGRITGTVFVGARPWGVAVSPDGTRIITANGASNDVAIISADGLKLLRRIRVGDHPWGVAVADR